MVLNVLQTPVSDALIVVNEKTNTPLDIEAQTPTSNRSLNYVDVQFRDSGDGGANEPNAIVTERSSNNRVVSIDRYRGLTVFLMVFVSVMEMFPSLGIMHRLGIHKLDREDPNENGIKIFPGLSFADLGAPMFMFAMALTMEMSFMKRKNREGLLKAITHSVKRWLTILVVGIMLDVLEVPLEKEWDRPSNATWLNKVFVASCTYVLIMGVLNLVIKVVNKYRKIPLTRRTASNLAFIGVLFVALLAFGSGVNDTFLLWKRYYGEWEHDRTITANHWSTLESLGAGGFVAMIAIGRHHWVKLAIGCVIFAAYTYFHEYKENPRLINDITQAGVPGAFGWGCIIMVGMILADFHRNKRYGYCFLLTAALSGAAYYAYDNTYWISKRSCSPSYVLITAVSSALFYWVVCCSTAVPVPEWTDVFSWWGRNPFLIYIIQVLWIDFICGNMPDAWIEEASVTSAAVQTAVTMLVLTIIACFLSYKKIYVKI